MIRKGMILLAAGAALALMTQAALVFAHADYDHSTPAEGATVTTAPSRVDAYFTAELDATGTNSLNVVNSGGTDVDNNDATIDSADATHMYITLQSGLANGVYTVQWATTSAEDGEDDSGTFNFTVQASGAQATSTAPAGGTPAATAAATATGGLPTTGSGSDASGGMTPMIAGLAAIGGLAVLSSAFVAARRRSGASQ